MLVGGIRSFQAESPIQESAAIAHLRAAFSLVRAWYLKDRNALKICQPYAEEQRGGDAARQRGAAAMNRGRPGRTEAKETVQQKREADMEAAQKLNEHQAATAARSRAASMPSEA